MDFLEIRRKAKERAAREASGQVPPAAAASEPKLDAQPEPEPAAPSGASPARGARAEAEPGGAQPGSPPSRPESAPAPAPSEDARFTTWRPGSGERPFVPPPEAPPPPTPAPSDFAVFDPARAALEAAPPPPFTTPPLSPPAFTPPVVPLGFSPAPVAFSPLPAASLAGPEERPPPSRPARLEAEAGPAERATGPGRRPSSPPADPLDEFFFRDDEETPALGALPAAGEPEVAPSEDVLEEYLTFRLGAEEYGVAIGQVREVLKAPAITEVPRAPAGILGVVTVRGEVVAVFDPRRRLGLPGAPPAVGEGRIAIVDDGGGPCGLLVDAVASVVRLARRSIEPCPQGIGGASAECLAGIGRERGRLFTVLDLPALLRRAPAAGRREREGSAHAP